MNYTRIALAALGAFVAYFVLGGMTFAITSFKEEFRKYPAVYRSQEGIKQVMPAGMVAIFVGMVVLAVLSAAIGIAAMRNLRYGYIGLAIFAVIGLAAALTRPNATPCLPWSPRPRLRTDPARSPSTS